MAKSAELTAVKASMLRGLPALPRRALPCPALQVGMRIALSCVLLGRGEFLAVHGGGLVQILCGFIGNVKDRGMLALMPVMDAVVQVGLKVQWWGAGS